MASTPGQFDEAVRWWRGGDLERAEKICRSLLSSEAPEPRVFELLAAIARAQGRQIEALKWLTDAVALAPENAGLRVQRGLVLRTIGGRDEEAVTEFRTAVKLEPRAPEAHLQLGNALKATGRLAEARESLETATKLAPENAVAWLNLGVTWLELGKPQAAVVAFRKATDLEPTRAEAWNILGAALNKAGDLTPARQALARAIELRPDYAAARNNLALVLKGQGRLGDAVAEYRAALAIAPNAATHSNLLYALNFVPGVSPDEVFAEHCRWNALYAEPLRGEWQPHANDREPTRRLNIGFVSPDLVNHAVAYFFEPYLQGRDRSAVHVTCYSSAKVSDPVTERLRQLSDRWRDVATMNDGQLAAQIRTDGIDVLVDMAGHTADHRLLVFARKAAPVQVTWLGYPNTTGLPAIDYRITDATADPPGKAERWHTEQLVRLSDVFLCYRPPEASPPAEVSRSPTEPVTFASFSNFAKLSDPCLETWAQIMERVPGSRLILKSRGLGDAGAVKRVFDIFGRHGISPERIESIGTLSGVAEHLALYHRVDIALDPFPYNGTTTTCEALWMGVPVVTLAGETHVQRVGASLLQAIGHPEWVTATSDEFVARATQMANEVKNLRATRAGLREQMHRSPLCNAAGFGAKMDAAFRAMWSTYCGGGVAESGRRSNAEMSAPASVRLSLCMIVKNGAESLPRCLDSVRGLADELIVVDTGSSDGSVEIARTYGAKIFSFPWIDDFSAARNRALEEATGAWILVLDADEALPIESVEQIRKVIVGVPNEAFNLVLASHGETGQTRAAEKARLFPNRATIRFEFPIHEQVNDNLSRAGVPIRDTAIEIDHIGYQDPATVRGKIARNRKIIEAALAKSPTRLLEQHLRYYRATAWCDDQRWDEAIADFERCLQIAISPTSRFSQIVHLCLAECYFQHGELAKSCEALTAIGELKTHPAAFALQAQIAMAKSDEAAVRHAYEALLAVPDIGRVPPVPLRPLKCRALQWLGEYWARRGRQDIGTGLLRMAVTVAKNPQASLGADIADAYRKIVPKL